jgi:hypothetical protein
MEDDVDFFLMSARVGFLPHETREMKRRTVKKMSEKDNEDCLMHKHLLVFFFYSRFIQVNYVNSHIIMKESISLNFYLEKKTYSSNYKLTNDEFDSRLCFSMAEVCNFKCWYLNLQLK